MLSPAQAQEAERMIAERLGRAEGILRSLQNRRLSAEQRDTVVQIRTFISQAREARRTDLLRANNLAERAQVLATDLAEQLK
jgi:hypothetical protein